MRVRSVLTSTLPCVLVLAVLLCAPAPAEARARVFVGGYVGVPFYAYPAPYPYWTPYPYVAAPEVPPPGWVPGHWEWRYDAEGRPFRVWVPGHLR